MKSSEFLNDVSHRQKNSLLELVGDKQLNNYLELSFSTIEKFIDSIPKDDDFNVNTLPSQILMELSQRVNNSAKACLLLNMTNLEFQSFVLLRDLLKIDLLMNYFLIYPNEIKMWWETYDENCLKKYAPVKLRSAIGDTNMNMKLKFDMEYKGHSELYTHPTPTSLQYQQGIKIKQNMHPGEMSSFWSCLTDLSVHVGNIAQILCQFSHYTTIEKEFRKRYKQLQSKSKFLKYYNFISYAIGKSRLEIGMKNSKKTE